MVDSDDEQNAPVAAGVTRAEFERMQVQLQEQLRQLQQIQPGIGDANTPHMFYQNRSAICLPALVRNDFQLQPQLIGLVKNYTFHGLPAEIPMDHIENFEEICSTTKANGVPEDWIRCKLFPFSLADKPLRWLKSLPPGSLTTWDQCRAAFLDHFYPKSKTTSLRNRIISFQQLSGESFCEAYERFKEYRRECPHHGYSEGQLISIFYDGVDRESKNQLNAASNGNFMTRGEQAAAELIKNLAASSVNCPAEYDRSKRVSSIEFQKYDELNEKYNQLLKQNQRSIKFCEDGTDAIGYQEFTEDGTNEQQEVNYVSGQGFVQNRGFYQNYKNHPNLSYRSMNVENPQDQVYPQQMVGQGKEKTYMQNAGASGSQGFSGQPGVQNPGFQKNFSQGYQKQFVQNPGQSGFQGGFQQKQPFNNFQAPMSSANNAQDELKTMMQQLLLNQQKSSNEINVKVDSMYNDLNGKFEALSSHVKKLDTQVAQTAEAITYTLFLWWIRRQHVASIIFN